MDRLFTLSGRTLEILTAVVRNYVATGEPVGSRTVSEKRRDGLSPASVRNVMAELEAEGYLTHPHTSAGRVPTDKGLRSYVDNLGALRLLPAEADMVRAGLQQAASPEERMARSSRLLATLTHQIAVVFSTPLSEAVLEHIHFSPLAEDRVLAVVVARGDVVKHRIVRIGEPITQEELDRLANYLNQNFAGWSLEAARVEIQRRLERERAAYDTILRRLRLLGVAGLLGPDQETPLYLEGTSNLIESIGPGGAERLAPLLRALEEKEKLVALLDECIREDRRAAGARAAGDQPLCVRIGLERDTAMRHFALIGAACSFDSGLDGCIAVIGPTRMPYERVMPAVAHLAGVFSELAAS